MASQDLGKPPRLLVAAQSKALLHHVGYCDIAKCMVGQGRARQCKAGQARKGQTGQDGMGRECGDGTEDGMGDWTGDGTEGRDGGKGRREGRDGRRKVYTPLSHVQVLCNVCKHTCCNASLQL